MKRFLVFFLLSLSLSSFSQIFSSALETVNDGISIVDLTLEANDCLYLTTEVFTKSERLVKDLNRLETALNDKNVNKYMNFYVAADYKEKIIYYHSQIKMYGTALSYMLKAIQRNLAKYVQSQAVRKALAVEDAVADKVEAIEENIEALTEGVTDLNGTKRKLAYTNSDAELRNNLENASIYIQTLMPKITRMNEKIDKVDSDVQRITAALRSSVGMQVMFTMSVIPSVVPGGKK